MAEFLIPAVQRCEACDCWGEDGKGTECPKCLGRGFVATLVTAPTLRPTGVTEALAETVRRKHEPRGVLSYHCSKPLPERPQEAIGSLARFLPPSTPTSLVQDILGPFREGLLEACRTLSADPSPHNASDVARRGRQVGDCFVAPTGSSWRIASVTRRPWARSARFTGSTGLFQIEPASRATRTGVVGSTARRCARSAGR
jgi:hypothetical protein